MDDGVEMAKNDLLPLTDGMYLSYFCISPSGNIVKDFLKRGNVSIKELLRRLNLVAPKICYEIWSRRKTQ